MIQSRHFHVSELVPPEIYQRFGERRSWNYVSPAAFAGLVALRMYVGKPFIINNYRNGGRREWAALRLPGSPYYSKTSQHTIANAYDILCDGLSPAELQAIVKTQYARFGIGGLEHAKTWTHIDFRKNIDGGLTEFWP